MFGGVYTVLGETTRNPTNTMVKPLDSNVLLQYEFTPYIRLVKFQLVRQIPDVYVSACVLAGKLFCCILQRIPKLFMV